MGYLNSNGLIRVWENIKNYIDQILIGKQDTITGSPGQVVGFNEEGCPVAEEPSISANDLTIIQSQVDFLTVMTVSNSGLDALNLAYNYYPDYWQEDKLQALILAEKLTEDEVNNLLAGGGQ